MEMILFVIFPIISLIFFGIGLSVIITKRPLVISSKVLRTIMLLAIMPIVLRPAMHAGAITILPAIMWIMILAISWQQASGFTVFGIAHPAFRESLVAVLNKLNIRFNEDMTGITIPEQNITLEAIVASNGVARIRTHDNLHPEWLKNLADSLKDYYASTPVTMTLTYSKFYCALGALLLMFMFTAIISR